jgi:putative two-component system response regulator
MAEEQKKIILVDDNDANLTACKKILKPYYTVYPAPSADKMFDILEHVIPDLILLDVEMPEINGYDAARTLKNTETYKKIPIIFLTARNDAISEMEGLNLGALDYIHKPFVSALLLRRMEMHLSLIDYQRILENRNKSKDELLSKLSREMVIALDAAAEMIKTAEGTNEPGIIKECLNKADGSIKSLRVLVNNTLMC